MARARPARGSSGGSAARGGGSPRWGGVGDAAVRRATGRGWNDWLRILDRAGSRSKSHREITRWLGEHHDETGGWWRQMITVGYEQARGLRKPHQKPDGFSAGVSRTMPAPVAELYACWADGRRRRAWLGDARLSVRKATENRSLRITWEEDGSSVHVHLEALGPGKSRVKVQHEKLAAERDVARRKEFWGGALDRLRERLSRARR